MARTNCLPGTTRIKPRQGTTSFHDAASERRHRNHLPCRGCLTWLAKWPIWKVPALQHQAVLLVDSDSRFCSTRRDSAPSSATRQVDRPPHNAHNAHHLVRAPAHAQKAPPRFPALCVPRHGSRSSLLPASLHARIPQIQCQCHPVHPSGPIRQPEVVERRHRSLPIRPSAGFRSGCPSAQRRNHRWGLPPPRADAPQMTRFKVPSSLPVWRRRTGKQDAASQTFAN